jgi:hypothetical protein
LKDERCPYLIKCSNHVSLGGVGHKSHKTTFEPSGRKEKTQTTKEQMLQYL